MDIYRSKERIYLSENIGEDVYQQSMHYSLADKSLLSSDDVYELDIDNICDVPDGRFRVILNNARFECLIKKENSERLWVFPSASRARARGRASIPLFERWSYYTSLGDSVLCVSDPMYYDYPNLDCGWFWGTEKENYREYLARLVEKIAKFIGINKDNVIFMGSSAGGTVSLHAASLFGHGVAISINGQLNFETEKYTKRLDDFKTNTGIDTKKYDSFNRNCIHEVLGENDNVRYIIVTNVSSEADIKDHLLYFCDKKHYQPTYGLSGFDNFVFWLYEAHSSSPHTAFEDKNILFALDYLTRVDAHKLEDFNGLYQLFSSFWNNRFVQEKRVSQKSYELNAVIKDIFDFIPEKKLANHTVEASASLFNRFEIGTFRQNYIYLIKLNAFISSDNDLLSVGVYDWDSKDFIFKYAVNSNVDYELAFYCSQPNVSLCIYSGLHSNADNKFLHINELAISSVKADNISQLEYFKMCNKNISARFDLKICNSIDNDIFIKNLSGYLYDVTSPWWINKMGVGYVITSDKGYAKFEIRLKKSDDLVLTFRGIDISMNGHRLTHKIDYTSIRVDNEELIDITTSCWHDNYIQVVRSLNVGKSIVVELHWRLHMD